MHIDTILLSSFNEIPLDEVETVRTKLNEILVEAGHPQIIEFEFDGPEDITVEFTKGKAVCICAETTMAELLDELGVAA